MVIAGAGVGGLTELGLGDRIEKLGAAPGTLAYYNRHGQLIWSEPRGYRWPQLSVHRRRFQLELLAAVRQRLGPDTVRTGHRLVGTEPGVALFDTDAGQVVSLFAEWRFPWLDVPGADGRRRRDPRIPDGGPGPAEIATGYKKAAGFHPSALNERPSLTPPVLAAARLATAAS